jgi:diguanylate cyclase (GGDEF)-like protein
MMAARLYLGAEAPPEWIARFVEDIPTGVAVFDRELRYVAANAPWIEAFSLARLPLAGLRHPDLDPAGGGQFAALQRRALAGETVQSCDEVHADAGGRVLQRAIGVRPRLARDGSIVGVVAALHDSAPSAAGRDTPDRLTGIAGREAFLERLRGALDAAKAGRPSAAMFLLDIGNFKGINDLYGTRVGDRVLKTIAVRLLTGIRAPAPGGRTAAAGADLVARLGADEFGIVLGSAPPSPADAEAFARRLLRLVAPPVVVGDRRIRLTANVGFVIASPAHCSADEVLRDLNAALQEAKARGPDSAQASEPALTSMAGRRLVMLHELRRALDEGEFVLHYQPILRLADERIVGAEALLRWRHPSEGLMPPKDFLPLLEETGLIVPVGCWVIREVARQMQVWQMLYGRNIVDWLSLNVSCRQFNDPSPLLGALAEIDRAGIPLDRLKLEITEAAVMRDPAVTRSVLGKLQALGVGIALDDFGTGYSALGALRHYDAETIKIDRGFTARLDAADGRELMLALLKIARIYGAAVVIEGVETEAQRDFLRKAGCNFGQGHLFSKPMDGSFFGAYALTHLVEGAAAG